VIEFARNVRLWFAPEEVRQEGRTPDYRFSLANERTFLAWIRTALGLLAVGIAIEALKLDINPVLRFIASLIFCALAVVASAFSWLAWARAERAMREGRPLPGPALGPVLVVGVVLAVAIITIGLFL
jgi:putative membrane protein